MRRNSSCPVAPFAEEAEPQPTASPSTSLAWRNFRPALQRRLLRHAAEQLGAALDFPATESLRNLALTGRASQKLELTKACRAERTHRELRLTAQAAGSATANSTKVAAEYSVAIPGEVDAPAFGIRLRIGVYGIPDRLPASHQDRNAACAPGNPATGSG